MTFATTQDILIRLLTAVVVATTLIVADTGLGDAQVSSDMLTITEQRSTSDHYAPGKYLLHDSASTSLGPTGCPACPDDLSAPTTVAASGSMDLMQRAADLPDTPGLVPPEQGRHLVMSDRLAAAWMVPPVTPPPQVLA